MNSKTHLISFCDLLVPKSFLVISFWLTDFIQRRNLDLNHPICRHIVLPSKIIIRSTILKFSMKENYRKNSLRIAIFFKKKLIWLMSSGLNSTKSCRYLARDAYHSTVLGSAGWSTCSNTPSPQHSQPSYTDLLGEEELSSKGVVCWCMMVEVVRCQHGSYRQMQLPCCCL
jgi:hypothetical protein